MYSIKIKSYSDDKTYPLYETLTKFKEQGDGEGSPETVLLEGTKIWHRKFHIFNIDEYCKWIEFYHIDETENNKELHIPGMHPYSILKDWDLETEDEYPVCFELLTFKDCNKRENVCILLNVECYIMNEGGQTVDKIVI